MPAHIIHDGGRPFAEGEGQHCCPRDQELLPGREGPQVMLLYYLYSTVCHAALKRRASSQPNGARVWRRRTRGHPQGGRVIEADSAVSAPSGAQVPAFGLKLSRSKSNVSEVMLRDGAGGGLTIQTDDGGRILIPPGRLRLEWSHGMARPLKEGKVESYLKQLDGGYLGESDELEIFPYDRAEEFTLRVGHRVEVGNKLRPQPDPRAQETAYRAAAASVLIPVGLPKLKVLGGDDQ